MELTRLIEEEEAFFLEGYAQGLVHKGGTFDVVLQKPILGAIQGSAMSRFYLEDLTLKVEYINSHSKKPMSIPLGTVADKDTAETWIAKVNRLYQRS